MTKCTVQGCVKDAGDKPLCLFHWKERQGFSQTSLQPTLEPTKPPSSASCYDDMKVSIRDAYNILRELIDDGTFDKSVVFTPEGVERLAIALFIQKREERSRA